MAANLLSLDHVHGVVETLQLCSLTLKVLFHVLAHSVKFGVQSVHFGIEC